VKKKESLSKAPDDPKLVFQYGEMYRQAFRVLQINQLLMPSYVCAALSLELYFKALIIDDAKGEVPEKHDLQTLFSSLSTDQQNKIRKFFDLTLSDRKSRHELLNRHFGGTIHLPNFNQALDASKNAFIELRYAFQIVKNKDRPPRHLWAAQEIWDGTRKLILELHPDWSG
jgi:hypothetical protein